MRVLRSIVVISLLIYLSGCDFGYLENVLSSQEDDAPSLVYEWNADHTVLTAKDPDTGEVVWYEVYERDADSNPVLISRYSPEDRLKWSKLYKWAGGLKVQEVCYDAESSLLWYSVFTYDGDKMISECNYDRDDVLQWFNVWEYSGGRKINQGRYNGSSVMTAGFVWEYDASDRVVRELHYSGSAPRTVPGGRALSSADFTLPEAGSPPVFPAFSTSQMGLSRWVMWNYDGYGYFRTTFDGDDYPLEMYRDDSRLTRAVTVELDYYSGHIPKSKVTKVGSDEVLAVELTYNAAGYLSGIDTSGKGLLVPLRYEIAYKADLSPDRVSVYQADTKLMYFTYDAEPRADLAVHPLDPIDFTGSVHTITQYDGGDQLLGTYAFSFPGDQILIEAKTADGSANGKFVANLNADSEVASFEAYNASGSMLWHYEYDYSDIAGKAVRIAEQKWDDIEGTIEKYGSDYGIDVSALTSDLLFN